MAQTINNIPSFDSEIDATGLRCPLPVLKARKALLGMSQGKVLKIRATDPVAPLDMAHFCAEAGHKLLRSDELDGIFTFFIESAGQSQA